MALLIYAQNKKTRRSLFGSAAFLLSSQTRPRSLLAPVWGCKTPSPFGELSCQPLQKFLRIEDGDCPEHCQVKQVMIAANDALRAPGYGSFEKFIVGGIGCDGANFLCGRHKFGSFKQIIGYGGNFQRGDFKLGTLDYFQIFARNCFAGNEYKLSLPPCINNYAQFSPQDGRDKNIGVKHDAHVLLSLREFQHQYLLA